MLKTDGQLDQGTCYHFLGRALSIDLSLTRIASPIKALAVLSCWLVILDIPKELCDYSLVHVKQPLQ